MPHSPVHSEAKVPLIDRERGREEAELGSRHPDCHKNKNKNLPDAFCLSFRVIPGHALVQSN